MADSFDYSIDGMDELRSAVRRNPQKVLTEVKSFFVRGIAAYNRKIIRNPWKVGESSGGAPKATGNLRDTHQKVISTWEAKIFPTAPYASYVHGTDGKTVNRVGGPLRPWLDYAYADTESEIEELQNTLLENIVGDLAK